MSSSDDTEHKQIGPGDALDESAVIVDSSVYADVWAEEEEAIKRIIEGCTDHNDSQRPACFDIVEAVQSRDGGTQGAAPTPPQNDPVVGIDLGTTYSSVCVWRNNTCEILADKNGTKNFASVVSFGHNRIYLGSEARNQIELNPENTFHNVKRIIGRKYNDIEVRREMPYLSYKLEDHDDRIRLSCRYKRMHPEEVSALILMHLKSVASENLGCDVKRAVITVPAYFTDAQRTATQDAARIAGLECVRIINEPTAAALAYGMTKRDREDVLVLIYDLGGGTLDVTLMRINMKRKLFQVLASAGNSHMGGEDFDNRLVDYCRERFCKQYGYANLERLSLISLQTLKRRCERAKRLLSTNESATIVVQDFYEGRDLKITLTRKHFEHICKDLFIICMKHIDDIMLDSGIDRGLVSEIIMVGGCTRIPRIQENIRNYFGKEPNTSVDPDLVVSMGASVMAYMCCNSDDPFASTVLLLDVIPLSIGIETHGGIMTKIIRRGTIVPTRMEKRFTTDTDYDTDIMIRIFEGERELVKDNRLLGSFRLDIDDPAPRGVPQVIVTISIDVNGVLDVTARDQRDEASERRLRITGNRGRLTDDEVDRLVKEAREYLLVDELQREISHLKFEIGDMCKTIIENLDDPECTVRRDDAATVRENVAKVRERMQYLQDEQTIDVDEYRDVSRKLKKRYATLILRRNRAAERVAALADDNRGTNVFNEDDEAADDYHTTITDDFEDDVALSAQVDEEERAKIIDARQRLVSLYTDIRTAITSRNSALNKQHRLEIMDLIEDTELWVHVAENVGHAEYEIRIHELDSKCNEIMDMYTVTGAYTYTPYTMSPLEQLESTCFCLRATIKPALDAQELPEAARVAGGNMLVGSITHAGAVVLDEAIADALDWIDQVRDDGGEYEPSKCLEWLNNINGLTQHIYEKTSVYSRDALVAAVPTEGGSEAAVNFVHGSGDIVPVNADDF
jgi:L1 cell adhesion molecule like protein